MKNNNQNVLSSFGLSINEFQKAYTNNDKNCVQIFKKGDIIACMAGYPYKSLCVVELIKDNVDIDNFNEYISGKSIVPLTSHLISANWFKIN